MCSIKNECLGKSYYAMKDIWEREMLVIEINANSIFFFCFFNEETGYLVLLRSAKIKKDQELIKIISKKILDFQASFHAHLIVTLHLPPPSFPSS